MFIPDHIKSSLDGASRESKDLLASILADVILSIDIPEESKIEVRIMKAANDLESTLHKAGIGFSEPIPPTEEGERLQKQLYPARKEFLEYLQLAKAGLDSFLAATPIPEIPPELLSPGGSRERF